MAALVVAAALFWAATSDAVYEATSPVELSFHVLLRKAYSIVAFALVGFMADKALGPSARPALRGALLVALYSAAIEVTQDRLGSKEGIISNGFDTLCGAVGGTLGVLARRITRSRWGV
ncbi:MAG TPA: hypothetical protein VHT05_05445 [Candidatus Elarobacter sp.]|nr:hypothetical protein [Candidatus Elarobacter sp.]